MTNSLCRGFLNGTFGKKRISLNQSKKSCSVPKNATSQFLKKNCQKDYKIVPWYCGYGGKRRCQYVKDAELYLTITFQAPYVFHSCNL